MHNINLAALLMGALMFAPVIAYAQNGPDYNQHHENLNHTNNVVNWKKAPFTQVSTARHEITVEGSRKDNQNDVMNKALYGAAKQTLNINNTWFRVINHNVETTKTRVKADNVFEKRYQRVPYQSCGLLGCKTTYRTQTTKPISYKSAVQESTTYSITLMFETGTGFMPTGEGVYMAQKITKS